MLLLMIKLIKHGAKKLSGFMGIINCRVGMVGIKANFGFFAGLG